MLKLSTTTKVVLVMVAIVALLAAGTAQAALLDYEGFDYSVGLLAGQGGYIDSGAETIEAGSLAYPGLVTAGNHENGVPGGFAVRLDFALEQMYTTAGTYYISYLFNMDEELSGLDGLGVQDLIYLGNSPAVSIQGSIQGSGGPTGAFLIAVNGVAQPGSIPISAGDTHLVVYRVTNGGTSAADPINVIIDPNLSLGEPDWNFADLNATTGENITKTDGTGTRLRFDRNWLFDEVRMATTWDEAIGALPVPVPTSVWDENGSGDWNTADNWSPATVPNSNLSVAGFGSKPTSAATVTTIAPVTVSGIVFDNINSVTIAASTGANIVTLDANGTVPSVFVQQGSHTITAPVNLSEAANVSVAAGSSLTFNDMNLTGNTLTKIGSGTMNLNGTVTTGGGSVVVSAGVLGGSGTVSGDLTNTGGTVSPGLSPGILNVVGDYNQTSGSLLIEIASLLGPGTGHDQLNVTTGSLSITGGSLDVVLVDFNVSAGDSFDILNWGTTADLNTSLFSLNLEAPLDASLTWDASALDVNGTISVILAEVLGDFNGDGNVTTADYDMMKANWLSTGQVFNATGDVASPAGQGVGFGDGIVDLYDFKYFKLALFPTGASGFASALASSVPEPSTVMLLLAAAPAWLSRRFRRRRIRSVKLSE